MEFDPLRHLLATIAYRFRAVVVDAPVRGSWTWDELVAAMHAELERLDAHQASGTQAREWPPETLLQGPDSDVLTHVGQLALMRRLEGHPVERQSYLRARVEVGRLGPDQAAPAPPLL